MKLIKISNHTVINYDHVKLFKISSGGTDHYIDFVIEHNLTKSVYVGDSDDAFEAINRIILFLESDQTTLKL